MPLRRTSRQGRQTSRTPRSRKAALGLGAKDFRCTAHGIAGQRALIITARVLTLFGDEMDDIPADCAFDASMSAAVHDAGELVSLNLQSKDLERWRSEYVHGDKPITGD